MSVKQGRRINNNNNDDERCNVPDFSGLGLDQVLALRLTVVTIVIVYHHRQSPSTVELNLKDPKKFF